MPLQASSIVHANAAMKFSARSAALALPAALVMASLCSCGQRGPLYLPPPDPPLHSSAPAQPVQPAQLTAPVAPSAPKPDDDKKDPTQTTNPGNSRN
jgi:predicted small lipoprotein YifL